MVDEAGINPDKTLQEAGIIAAEPKPAVPASTPNKTAFTVEEDLVEAMARLSIHATVAPNIKPETQV